MARANREHTRVSAPTPFALEQFLSKRNQRSHLILIFLLEDDMATNKPKDGARKGAVKKRTQLKNPLTNTSTKRNKNGGQFMAVKKTAKKFKGVRREKAA